MAKSRQARRAGVAREAARLEAAQDGSFGHTLLACARHYDELGQARLNEEVGAVLARPAVMRLVPHVTVDGIRATELARRTDVTKQAVSQTLSRLRDLGLVELVPDPTDGRAQLVRMTKAGVEVGWSGSRGAGRGAGRARAACGSRRRRSNVRRAASDHGCARGDGGGSGGLRRRGAVPARGSGGGWRLGHLVCIPGRSNIERDRRLRQRLVEAHGSTAPVLRANSSL
jgi:DNA-binding transcriptional ArsR family regulator